MSSEATYGATDPVSAEPAAAIAQAWEREAPGLPTDSIPVVTPVWRLAKLFADDRRRALAEAGVDAATMDLLSTLRRSGDPWTLTTRELSRRVLVTAGAISQRLARAEAAGLVVRRPGRSGRRSVDVELTAQGHELVEASVAVVLTRESALLAGLPDEDRHQLARLLDLLLTQVRSRVRTDEAARPRGEHPQGQS